MRPDSAWLAPWRSDRRWRRIHLKQFLRRCPMRKSRIALAVASFVAAAALALGTVAGSSHGRVGGAAGSHTATLASTTTGQGAQNLVPVQLGPAAEATETPDPTAAAPGEPTQAADPRA